MFNSISIYVHIPFCASRCTYCDFNTYAGMDHKVSDYVDALAKEVVSCSRIAGNRAVETIFIGGGTPSHIDERYMRRIINCLREFYDTGNTSEITIESNPGTLDDKKLDTYISLEINRLSIGLQCWQQNLLDRLGRRHTSDDFLGSVRAAKKAGFENINADLIFGIPGQTMEQWRETLFNVIDSGVKHISCYSLKQEEGTPLDMQIKKGKLSPVSDDDDRRMYHEAIEILASSGYRQYEISNFAFPGYECRHNTLCWMCGEYLGFGAGAHSYMEQFRYANVNNIAHYIDKINNREDAVVDKQYIDRKESMKEYMILGLRLTDGLSMRGFKEKYGDDVYSVFGEGIRKSIGESLVEIENDRLRLTQKGLDLANRVFLEFI